MTRVLVPGAFGAGVVGLVLLFIVGAWAVAVILLVVGLAAVAYFWRSIAAAVGWHAAQLEVPTLPLMLGSDPRLIYRRRPRKLTDIPACNVHCTVVCEERATYRQGTKTRTDTSKVFEQTFTGHGTGTPHGLEASIPVRIPATAGAPSFDLGDNEVQWYLLTTVKGPGLPEDEQRFPLPVGPILDVSQRNERGDR
ncbi:MAG: hypothetical protein OEV40_05100 [Acidimicrobiia bacterium]|nr:hypothetical protein [Acidimicrobiia bacterium]